MCIVQEVLNVHMCGGVRYAVQVLNVQEVVNVHVQVLNLNVHMCVGVGCAREGDGVESPGRGPTTMLMVPWNS